MSVKATTAVWEQSQSKGPARLLLLAIADHADPVGVAWPSVARLARMCGWRTRSAVQKNLEKLSSLGELKIEHNKGRKGANLYRITLDFGENSSNAKGPPNGDPRQVEAVSNDETRPASIRKPGGLHLETRPASIRRHEPSRTPKNREGEPARARKKSLPPSDLGFCLGALRKVFPNAPEKLDPAEKAFFERWQDDIVRWDEDKVDSLVCWFKTASDQVRGQKCWPRSRTEFLAHYSEAMEKVGDWWDAKGRDWWAEKQAKAKKKRERAEAEKLNKSEMEDEVLSPHQALAFLKEGGLV